MRFLSGNAIKILAALFMVVDHIGLFFFPGVLWLRCVGRISFPLFAYMIAEGCRYTGNALKHISLLALSALVCQTVQFAVVHSLDMCVLVTFTLSVAVIYSLNNFKRLLFNGGDAPSVIIPGAVFIGMVFLTAALNGITDINGIAFSIEYGFWGCMLPVFASLFDFKGLDAGCIARLDCFPVRFFSFAAGLAVLCASAVSPVQSFALISLAIIVLYNGERGRLRLKYFFYVFYPAHLGLFYVIACFIA